MGPVARKYMRNRYAIRGLLARSSHRLVKRNAVAQPLRLRRRQAQPGLLRLLLCNDQLQVAGRTQPVAVPDRLQRCLRRRLGGGLRMQGLRVVFDRAQGVGDVAQGVQNHALVIGGGRVEGGERRPFLGGERGVEERLRQLSDESPDGGGAAEQRAGVSACEPRLALRLSCG